MTPADLARNQAIAFECKKNSLRQTQNGDWQASFTIQGIDMDQRLTKAVPGTRYQAVLVEIGADELPVQRADAPSPPAVVAKPLPGKDKRSAGAKQSWEDMLPQKQAGMRLKEPAFAIFLREAYPKEWRETSDANECLKLICGVASKKELETVHASRMLWKGLDESFKLWERL